MTTTDEKWVERIRQWKESGKTAEDFAAGQPYKASTLKWRAAGCGGVQREAGNRARDKGRLAPSAWRGSFREFEALSWSSRCLERASRFRVALTPCF